MKSVSFTEIKSLLDDFIKQKQLQEEHQNALTPDDYSELKQMFGDLVTSKPKEKQ
jgi:phosphorylcholine metabolism protein LicD